MLKLLALCLVVISVSCYEQAYWDRVNDYDVAYKMELSPARFSKRSGGIERRFVIHKANNEKKVFRVRSYSVFAPDAEIEVQVNGTITSYPPPRNGYKGIGSNHQDLRFIAHEDGTFSGAFVINGDRVVFDLASNHKSFMSKRHVEKLAEGKYVLIRESMMDPDTREHLCGTGEHKHSVMPKRSIEDQSIVPALVSAAPSPCPQTNKQLMQAVVTDAGFVAVVGGAQQATDYIEQVWMDMNVYYEREFNVHLTIESLQINESPGGPDWNTLGNSCPGIETKLDQVSAWKQDNKPDAGLLHLMTNCYPSPGTIGLAWVGTICRTNVGSGISNHLNSRHSAHRVVGHETGHNFDCSHDDTNGGIMFPSVNNRDSTDYDRFSQNSRTAACAHISSINCLVDFDSGCTVSCGTTECGPSNCVGRSCGVCQGLDECKNGQCVPCDQQCGTKECGPDACGNSDGCGTCASGSQCRNDKCEVIPGFPQDILQVVNDERALYGLNAVEWDTDLLSQVNEYLTTCTESLKRPSIGGDINENGNSEFNIADELATIIEKKHLWTCETDVIDTSDGNANYYIWRYKIIVSESQTKMACSQRQCGDRHLMYCAFTRFQNYNERPFAVDQCNFECTNTRNPNVCTERGQNCGSAFDGCENIPCGSCSGPNTCSSEGRCECTPSNTCSGACGMLNDGCGTTLNCGNCSAGQECENNLCVTPPPDPLTPAECDELCTTRNIECGGVTECPGHVCGDCVSGEMCSNFQCVTCQGCHAQATCDLSGSTPQCKCVTGYEGDGRDCNPKPINEKPSFKTFKIGSDANWRIFQEASTQNSIDLVNAPSPHCIRWEGTEEILPGGTMTIGVSVLRSDETTFAAIGYGMGNTQFPDAILMLYIEPESSTQMRVGQTYYWGRRGALDYQTVDWAVGEWKDIKMSVEAAGGTRTQTTIAGTNFVNDYTFTISPDGGGVGLCGQGSAFFKDVLLLTESKLEFVISGCPSEEFVRQRLKTMLGITDDQLSDMTLVGSGCTSSKRQAAAGATTAVSVTVVGTKSVSSISIVSNLQNIITSGSNIASASGIVPSSIAVSSVPVAAATPAVAVTAVGGAGAAAASGGLGAGAIAGIAVGSVVGIAVVAAAIGGVVYASKKQDVHTSDTPQSNTSPGVTMSSDTKQEDASTRDGVNVMGGPKRPDGPSITARNQNVVVSPN